MSQCGICSALGHIHCENHGSEFIHAPQSIPWQASPRWTLRIFRDSNKQLTRLCFNNRVSRPVKSNKLSLSSTIVKPLSSKANVKPWRLCPCHMDGLPAGATLGHSHATTVCTRSDIQPYHDWSHARSASLSHESTLDTARCTHHLPTQSTQLSGQRLLPNTFHFPMLTQTIHPLANLLVQQQQHTTPTFNMSPTPTTHKATLLQKHFPSNTLHRIWIPQHASNLSSIRQATNPL